MRILELNLERGWRGGERQTLWSAQYFNDAGHATTIVARKGEALARRAAKAGLPLIEVESSAELMRMLATSGSAFDILHAQTAQTLTACVLTRWLHGRPVVVTRRVAFPLGSRLTRFKYRRATQVIAISRAAASALQEAGIRRIQVIPSAVRRVAPNHARVQAFRDQHGLNGYRVLATMGALTPEKDPCTMIEAIRQLRQLRDDFRFVHFGEGTLRPLLEARIAEYGLQQSYLLVGFHDNVEEFFPMLDGFVMSSRQEGLGSAVLDAMMHGVPVVSTNAGGLAESLGDGRGVLVPAGDAPALAAGISRLLADDHTSRQAREEMIEQAQAWVERECSLAAMGERYLRLFETIVAGRRLP